MINFTNLISKVSKVSQQMGSPQHLPMTYLPVDSVSIVSRQSDLDNTHAFPRHFARLAAMVTLLLTLACGNVCGASPLTVETPDARYYTQDGVTVFGENTTGKMKNSSSQKCYNTNNASVIVFSELTNITGISFDMCLAGDGSGEGNAISLYTSTGGVFAIPSSGFTATKGGSALGSLSNIQAIKANQSSLTSISVTFDSPVKGIELKKVASTNIRNIVVTYNNTTLPSVYFKATTTSTADVANVETTPSGGSMTVDTKTTKKTINGIDYYQAESGSQTINLGTGNTFQAGDQIVLEFCGSGNNKTVGPIIQKTTNCTISVTVNDKVPAKVAYIVSAGDGIQGQTSATIIRTSSDLYIRSFSVLRAAAGCPNYSFHTGGNDVQTNNTQSCFVQVGSSNEWQLTNYTIPADTKFFVGERGWWYNNNLGSNNSRSSAQTWAAEMYLAMSFDAGDASGSPKLGQATGAVGTVRIYDNSNWNNLNAAFIPDGYVLRIGSTDKSFAVHNGNEYRSELVELSSSNARDLISVGVVDENDDYVATANTQTMQHLFLRVSSDWAGSSAKFSIYDIGASAFKNGFMVAVPGESNLYEGWIDGACTSVIFVRHNSTATSPSWDNDWNQTGDLTLQSGKNLFTITQGTWNGQTTGWSAYEKKGKFRMNDNFKDKNWYVRFNPYHVLTYDANGGSGAPAAQSVAADASPCQLTVSSTEPTRTDYIFEGWSTSSSAVSPDGAWDPGDTHAMTGDVTLYAVWTHCSGPSITVEAGMTGQTYTVGDVATTMTVTAAAGNGGTLHYHWCQYNVGQNPETQSIDAVGGTDANTYTPSTASAHEGQIFYCVVSEEGCSTTVKSAYSGAITVNAAPTLYTVTYNVNGGGSVDPTSATQASVGASLTLPTPTWSGYTFEGWYNAGTKIGNAGASYTPTANITLYAHWTDDISGKVFSFIDNNYGDKFKAFDLSGWVTGDASKKDKTYTNATTGVQLVIDNGSWENKSNAISALVKQIGSGDKVSDIDIIIPTGKIATVKISYNAYGTGDGYRLTVNGTAQANPSNKLDDGHTNAQVISNIKEITLSNQTGTLQLGVSNTSNNNYIGRVSAVITGYTVSYDKGTYGTGTLASGTKTHGSNFTLSSNSSAFTRDGYTYDGWSINADGSTKDYNLGGTYSTDAAITLYPHWVANATISATLESDEYMRIGAAGMELSLSITGASSDWYYRVKNSDTEGYQTPDETTYTTTSWTMTSTIGAATNHYVVELYNGSKVKMATSNTITVYGETGHPMTISAGDGGSASPASTWANGDHLHPTITATPSSGYRFVNWTLSNANATLADATSASTTITSASGACTITANFVECSTVTYMYNGATSGASPASETAASVTLPTPTRTGYVLDGWYTTAGTKVGDGGDSYSVVADITLYARWEESCAAGGTEVLSSVAVNSSYTVVALVGANVASSGLDGSDRTQVGSSSEYANKLGSSGYVRLYPKSGSAFAAGDILYYKVYNGKSSEKSMNVAVFKNDETKYQSSATSIASYETHVFEITLTSDMINATNGYVQVMRGSSNGDGAWFVSARIETTSGGGGTCYHVYYHGNGAESGYVSDTTSYAANDDPVVLGNVGLYPFVRAGYTFSGWNTEAGGGGTAYAPGATITDISSDVTLYAQWSSGTLYSVTYNGNSNTDGTAPATASHAAGSNVTVLGNTGSLEKTNYTFDGWATANDGTGTSYAAGGTISSIAADVTLYAKWKQTVTLNTGSQGSGAEKTPYIYWNGAALSDATVHSADGYTLQGYYTVASGGTKVLNDDGSFAGTDVSGYITSSKWSRTGTTTLYAQWRAAGGASCNTMDHVTDFPSSGSTGATVGNLTVTYSGSSVEKQTSKPLYNDKSGNTIKIGSSGADKYVQGYLGGNEIGSLELGVGTGNTTTGIMYAVVFSASSTFDDASVLSYSKSNSEYEANIKTATSDTLTNITVPSGAKYFRIYRSVTFNSISCGSGSSVYVWHIKACSSGSSTHTITYNNGGGSGSMASNTGIADNGSQTLTTKTFTAPTNYTFAGWVADVDVTIGGDTKRAGTLIADGATITNITTDINLTAKWSLPLTLNTGLQGGDADENLTVYYNSTSITGHTPHTAAGYRLMGYYTASSDGTKVLNADGSFAATAVSDYITDGKWIYTTASSLTLYAQWEAAALLKWNLQINKSESPITTTSKESATVRISTDNMTNLTANGGLTITGSAKSALTSKIATTANTTGDNAGKYMSVQFQIANGYKLVPTAINVKVQPISHSQTVYLVLEDNNSHSIDYTSSSISKGSTQTVTMSNGSSVEFTGTVTLKIYCYGTAENDGYRLGTPIEINGSVEEACTMPSYTGLDYSQTEYIKDAVASAITVTDPADVTTYLWKQNTVNDRSGTTPASGTNNTASYTPPTTANGKLYYWCELTNACGTVKTPTVAITVRTDKTDPTATWTDPATVNYGGGNYTLRATVNSGWDGTLTAGMLIAPTGIRIYDASIGTDGSSRKYIEVKFDVQTSFDRTEHPTSIPFTLSLPETTSYDAVNLEHDVAYTSCSGAGAGSSYNIRMRKTVTKDGNYYYSANADGWISPNTNSSHGTAKAGTAVAPFDTVASSNTSNVWIKTYHANINKVRMYGDFSAKDMTVAGVYKNTTYFTANAKYSVDYAVVYNGDENADNLGEAGEAKYVDITLNTALDANDILLITFSATKARPMGAILTEASGGTLSTALTFGTAGPITKTQSDANFTNVATKTGENNNSLGAITYSSSNTSCATVNAKTGEVTITATGTSTLTTTITATLAASGCYQRATTSYVLNVTGQECTINAGTLTLTSGNETKCPSANVTLTLTGHSTDGTTVTWYRGETDVTASVSENALTTTEAGIYSVVVTKNACSVRTNSITISNISAEASATKIVDEWYIKNGRLTPDIALWTLDEGSSLSSVTWSPSNETGLTASDDIYEKDGVVYLTGKEPVANNSGSDKVYTLTLTVADECGGTNALSSQTITLKHQKNTDKHVLAFVVNGTAKEGFTDGITAAQTTSVPLYNTLTENFDVLATNIYSTDDEQKLKEYYSQFDILCITDYPNSNTKGVHGKKYVDAIGALIDIRPILTMEAFVSDKDNWKAKGVSGSPKDPTTRQYNMLLQCKDHEIFAGTTLTKIGEGDEAMYKINMVDSTKESYATLDATYGGGTHKASEGYKYHDCPALQGFTYTSAMSDMLPLGLIQDGSGNDLQVGLERQHVMEARMMVIGVNAYAMERLTTDGEQVIVNALKYLMKKNAEDISDCSVYFDNATGDGLWDNAANWGPSYASLPQPTQEVRILQPCTLNTRAHVAGVKIVPDGKYNYGSSTAAGKLTIAPTGALIVEGKVQAVTAPKYYEKRATQPSELILNTDDTDGSNQACLIFNNDDASTKATVNMYSLGRVITSTYQFQYMAVPMEVVPVNPSFANETHGGTIILTYVWNENGGWSRRGYYEDLYAFEGIGITTTSTSALNYQMKGNLTSTAEKEIALTNGSGAAYANNIIGNSWSAPIDIASLKDAIGDDASVQKTVYIYCTGKDGENATSGTSGDAGQWLAIPIDGSGWSGWTGLKVIPSMQAFLIRTSAETSLTLNYDEVVRSTATSNLNEPLRAPKRESTDGDISLTTIHVADSKTFADLRLFEGERFDETFDNGWEAEYLPCDGRTATLYAETEIGKMAVLATPELEGTQVGFAPGQETAYTFTFAGGTGEYYLNDIKTQKSALIQEGNTYSFEYENGDAANRFYISRTAIDAPAVGTGIDNTQSAVKVQKFIYQNKLYILRNGVLYDATGKVVK